MAARLGVRVLGELMVTAGALVLLFVLWQLVWTDVTASATQRSAVEGLHQQWEQQPAGAVEAPAPSTDPPEQGAPQAAPQDPSTAPSAAEPPEGEGFAVVHVPRFADGGRAFAVGADQGVGLREVLNDGVLGHYPGTAMPGGVGNASFAGHRTTYGAPLSRIAELLPGDAVVVESADAWFVYRVTGSQVVAPERVEVIAPDPDRPGAEPARRLITLTACHPRYSARQRYVVHGELESWQPRAAGPPSALSAPVAPVAG